MSAARRPTAVRRIVAGMLTLALCGPSMVCADNLPTLIELGCDAPAGLAPFALPPEQALRLHAVANAPAWIEVDEAGQEISLAPSVADIEIGTPLRYGTRLVSIPAGETTIEVRRHQPNRARGEVRVALHCADGDSGAVKREWLRRVEVLAKRAAQKLEPEPLAAVVADLRTLQASAPDATARALVEHLVAQVLLVSDEDADSVDAFAAAQAAWLALGDADRAAVAMVGRVEGLRRLGRNADVIDLATSAAAGKAQGYFPVRLQTSRCLALDALGRLDQSAACYEAALRQLDALDERIDYVNTLHNYAIARMDAGQLEQAGQLAARALAQAAGPYAPIVRGRIDLTLLDIELARGDQGAALAQADAAMREFVQAASPGWQAIALVRVASIYRELGAYDEAYLAIAAALQRYRLRDAPARVGGALLVLASIDRLDHHADRALTWSLAASRIFADLKMPQELERARLAQLRIQLDGGALDQVEQGLAADPATSPLNANNRALLASELSIRRGDFAAARSQLDALKHGRLRLSESIQVARLDAGYARAHGDEARAAEILRDALTRIGSVAQSSANPALRLLLANQARSLRAAALDALLPTAVTGTAMDPVDARSRADAAWRWLALDERIEAEPARAEGDTRAHAEAFDRAIATELLEPSAARARAGVQPASPAQRELLSLLARPASAHAGATVFGDPIRLDELQAALEPDALLLVLAEGNAHAALLGIMRNSAAIHPVDAPEIRAANQELRALLRSPQSPQSRIDAATRRLSDAVFGAMPARPPSTLLVLADDTLGGVPWSLLRWPGSPAPLLDTTMTGIVRMQRGVHAPPSESSRTAYVVVADQAQTGLPGLPALAAAGVEPQLIAGSVVDREVVVASGAQANRSAVMAMLATPGAWLHVAAHGMSRAHQLGFAGIWLEPAQPGEAPPFLSWLDILEQGVRADLVVLNACQLGDSADVANGNIGFASAVSKAGARQVVAAMWAVSDAASATWLPALYANLAADPAHEAAAALRAAQLRLRESRMFRHPFYWSGLQAFTRLDVPGQPSPPSVVASPAAAASATRARIPAAARR